jgi:DNA modification methylase
MENLINTIVQADCLEYLKKLPNECVDLVLIDPPYGVNYKNDFYDDSVDFVKNESVKWLKELFKVLKDGCHCYIFTGTKSLNLWLTNIENSEFEFKNVINVPAYCNGQYLKNNFYYRTEHILYLSKGKAKNLNKVDFIKTSEAWKNDKRNPNKQEYTYSYPNFWDFLFANQKAGSNKLLHPNQKNSQLLKILINLSTNTNDIVLDCFMGSGSTAIASFETGRNFLGCERDEKYCEIANTRIEKWNTNPQKNLF